MRRVILVAVTLTGLVATSLIPQQQTSASDSQTDLACAARCDEKRDYCRNLAKGRYIMCGQAGGTVEECQKVRAEAYADCIGKFGCRECFDGRFGIVWYCACGRSSLGSSGGGGTILPYNYSEETVPWEYTWEGMGCDIEPMLCDPMIWN